MRLVLQRVSSGKVSVDGEAIAAIGPGLVILLGIAPGDGEAQARTLAEKIAHLRIFEDEVGKMNRSLLDTGGEAIVVSQFTLYADCRKGRRPSFVYAAPPELAEPLAVRRTVSFSEALYEGAWTVEGVTARRPNNAGIAMRVSSARCSMPGRVNDGTSIAFSSRRPPATM